MLGVKSELGRIAAVLHDVVEDTDITLSDLRREGFSDEVVGIVDLLTQRDGEQDLDYWARIRTDRVAVEVKLADLRDNMDRSRIARFTTEDARRLEKYQKAWTFLNGEPGRKQTHGGRPARRPEGHPAEPDPHRGVRKDE
jgi:(p)ppGpp synthase/HD superfamily hydrolase